MGAGNPKKYLFLNGLKTKVKAVDMNDIALVYKDKNHRVKKVMSFKTKNDILKLT